MASQNRTVITIPATRTPFPSQSIASLRKRRVAAYARVSTDKDEQFSSYEAQIDYYTNYIKSKNDWEFIKVYTDEGITGTSTKHREGFKNMVADALDGKIDLIITKSVSRFARNTVDSLTTIRQLKEKGVECFFEKENIWTFDGKGELLITIMSSLAQEESRSISENCTWGQRKRMQDGRATVPFSHFLGYDRGPNGKLVVNREQAVTVRRIYSMYMQGIAPKQIAAKLTAEGIASPSGKKIWYHNTIRSILTNEKYKGDALLQKKFTESYLTKKQVKNVGQLPQYYVSGDHEAIIEPDVFDMIQREIKARSAGDPHRREAHVFSYTVYCGECGGRYIRNVWHSTSKHRRYVWQCKLKYASEKKCPSQVFSDEELQEIFILALNKLVDMRDEVSAAYDENRQALFNTEELEVELHRAQDEMGKTAEMFDQLIRENAAVALDQSVYNTRFEELRNKFDELKANCKALEETIQDKTARKAEFRDFFRELMKQPEIIVKFDPTAYHTLVERMTVFKKDRAVVRFRNGTEIEV